MKQKFLLCQNDTLLTQQSKVFAVWIGSSHRDQVKKTLIECFASDIGWLFRPWDEDSDFYLLQHTRAEERKTHLPLWPFDVVSVGVQVLYRHILDGSWLLIESPSWVKKQGLILQCMLNLDTKMKIQGRQAVLPCNQSPRKTCVNADRESLSSALVNFGIILILYLVAARLDYISMFF